VELADTSVWARQRRPGVVEWFPRAVEDGSIAVCDMVVMEILTSAVDHADFLALEDALQACPWHRVEPQDWDRAREVYRLLAQRPLHHRSVKIPDLLIAAVAERARTPLVHYDEDYDRIAAVTGQPVRWAALRGSL
jgi:predicted nucleic acid-binding protein